eukprot:gene11038-biopygen5282
MPAMSAMVMSAVLPPKRDDGHDYGNLPPPLVCPRRPPPAPGWSVEGACLCSTGSVFEGT